jgi:hypothetical protein
MPLVTDELITEQREALRCRGVQRTVDAEGNPQVWRDTYPGHDLSAFWLYPDWDGPIKEPFWMRPPKVARGDYSLVSGSRTVVGRRLVQNLWGERYYR